MSDAAQFSVLTGTTLAIFLVMNLAVLINRWHRTNGPGSARFVTASALTNLARKIRPVVCPGLQIWMPAGYGLYPLTLSEFARRSIENQLAAWLRGGVEYIVIISSPNEEALRYWQSLVDRLGSQLKVYLLDRKAANPQEAKEISTLDLFHPVLMVKDDVPLGMWLEAIHEPRSEVAYNVQFVAAPDIVDEQRERFFRLLGVLRRLTRPSAHLRVIVPSAARADAKTTSAIVEASYKVA